MPVPPLAPRAPVKGFPHPEDLEKRPVPPPVASLFSPATSSCGRAMVDSSQNGAVFFDLDRTLLRGASGPVISEALRAVGVVGGRSIPGEKLLYRFFDAVGETLPAMFFTRQLARYANGWDRALVQEAGQEAAARLIDEIPPFAKMVIAQHQDGGPQGGDGHHHPLRPGQAVGRRARPRRRPRHPVLRTGRPLHRQHRRASSSGVPASSPPCGPGPAERGVDLADSWAYSDCIFDMPLLSAVGHPVAVNPDPRLHMWRWPGAGRSSTSTCPTACLKLGPLRATAGAPVFAQPALFPWVRFDIDGVEHIPAKGPAILVANHRSYFDPLAIGVHARPDPSAGAVPGQEGSVRRPRCGPAGHGARRHPRRSRFRLRRAARRRQSRRCRAASSWRSCRRARSPAGRRSSTRNSKGRWGAAQLAAETRAPVIPIGLWGTERVWPRNAECPMC